jgi:hypothetical protein
MTADRQLADAQRVPGVAPRVPDADASRARPRLRLRVFGIDPGEASFERRGFGAASPAAQARLEAVGRTFVHGYRTALADDDPVALAAGLEAVDLERRGFAYEGAAMALALLDRVAPWRRDRLASFIAGPARDHVYMAHVGAGWALARMRRGPRAIAGLDPLLRWLALDGYGFHEGYFRPAEELDERRPPMRFRGYAARAFDQGLGRSLWFATGADPDAAARSIGRAEASRRADLWSGVALAATYAGGGDDALGSLPAAARGYWAHVAQGAAFGAAARERAGNPAAHTELACRVLAGCTARAAAEVTDAARRDLPHGRAEPAYEVWRARIRARLAGGGA